MQCLQTFGPQYLHLIFGKPQAETGLLLSHFSHVDIKATLGFLILYPRDLYLAAC